MKKQKLTPEELAKARQEKINSTLQNFQIQLMQLGKQKAMLVNKLVEVRRLGLTAQEKQARGLLGNCLAQEKRVLGMQMQLELAVQSRDLSNLQQSFMECVSSMSDEISENVTEKTVKKAKNKYLKALHNISQQNERTDDMLAMGDFALVADANTGKFTQFDSEIDSLLEQAEYDGTKNGQRY